MIIINKAILIGRLTKDPELNYAPNTGKAVCRFTLAITRPFKKDETDFINCIAFGKTGETISQYITKGQQLAITGSIRTGSYTDKEGVKRYTTDIITESFEFIGNNGAAATNNNNNTESQEIPYKDIEPIYDEDSPF